jgi:hypothetical protein
MRNKFFYVFLDSIKNLLADWLNKYVFLTCSMPYWFLGNSVTNAMRDAWSQLLEHWYVLLCFWYDTATMKMDDFSRQRELCSMYESHILNPPFWHIFVLVPPDLAPRSQSNLCLIYCLAPNTFQNFGNSSYMYRWLLLQ